jgi:hypothetical protein
MTLFLLYARAGAKLLRVVAHEKRLLVPARLYRGEQCVGELVRALGTIMIRTITPGPYFPLTGDRTRWAAHPRGEEQRSCDREILVCAETRNTLPVHPFSTAPFPNSPPATPAPISGKNGKCERQIRRFQTVMDLYNSSVQSYR